jgi:hypothetical protein
MTSSTTDLTDFPPDPDWDLNPSLPPEPDTDFDVERDSQWDVGLELQHDAGWDIESDVPPERDWDADVATGRVGDVEILAECLASRPGAGRLAMLTSLNLEQLDAGQRIDYLVAMDRAKSWLDAQQHQVLAVIDADDPSPDSWAQADVACALRIAERTAQARLETARLLVTGLPRTFAALTAGLITPVHAAIIVDAAYTLDPEHWPALEDAVLTRAATQTPAGLRRSVNRAVLRISPKTAEERHDTARETRRVELLPQLDGMSELRATLPAADAETIFTRLTAAAGLIPTDDGRTLDQKRADLLVDGLLAGIAFESLPRMQGRRPSVQVIVSLSTLLGLDEEPGDLAGYGPITADTARALAADQSGTWRRLVTDPITSQLLDFGTTTYRPPQALADFVIARDGVCVHPTCNHAGYRSDIDHMQAASAGGPTNPANTAILCRRHHRLKHQTAWNYTANNNGTYTWTSPTGHHYQNQPPTRWTEPRPPTEHNETNTRTTPAEPKPPATRSTTEPNPPAKSSTTEPKPATTRAELQPHGTATTTNAGLNNRSEPLRPTTSTNAGLNIQHHGTSEDATRDFLHRTAKTRPKVTPEEHHGTPVVSDSLTDDPPF